MIIQGMDIELKHIFIAGIEKLFNDYNSSKGKLLWSDIAQHAGLSDANLSSIRKGKRNLSEEKMKSISDFFKMKHIDVIKIGFKEIHGDQLPIDNKTNLPTIEIHKNTIMEFQNPPLALKINQKLIELEKINPNALNDILKHINWKIYEESENPDNNRVSSGSETNTTTRKNKRA